MVINVETKDKQMRKGRRDLWERESTKSADLPGLLCTVF